MEMYPPLGPVKVGDYLRYESSGDWNTYIVKVNRITKKLIWIDDIQDWDASASGFSREHGALFDGFGYDAYAGRLRQINDADRYEIVAGRGADGVEVNISVCKGCGIEMPNPHAADCWVAANLSPKCQPQKGTDHERD